MIFIREKEKIIQKNNWVTEYSRVFFKNQKLISDGLMVFGSGFGHHGFIVTSDSKLFGFGSNKVYQLGEGNGEIRNLDQTLTEIKFFSSKRIRKISCLESETLFLTENNEVYLTGSERRFKKSSSFPTTPKLVVTKDQNKIVKVIDIFAGCKHKIFLSDFLEVYSFGSNYFGQLGHGDQNERQTGEKVFFSEKIISVSCGAYYSCFISIVGNVFVCGYNNQRQLGIESKSRRSKIPRRILFSTKKKIVQIACGWDFTFFVTEDNQVYGTGDNKQGQLSFGSSGSIFIPTPVETLKDEKVNFVKCGAKYSLFQCKNNKIFLCGSNVYGQQANGNFENVMYAKLFSIEGKKIIQSLPIRRSPIYFTNQNEVYGCGQNDEGQLFCGNGNLKNPNIFKICNLKVKTRKENNEKQKEKLERYEFLLFCVKDDTIKTCDTKFFFYF